MRQQKLMPPHLIEKHARLRAKITARRKEIERHQFELYRKRGEHDYLPTATEASIQWFSRDFAKKFHHHLIKGQNGRQYYIRINGGRFESLMNVEVSEIQNSDSTGHPIGWINLGFEKENLIIESMQTSKNAKPRLNEFRRITKKQTLDYLLEKAEITATQLGFKEVKIRVPETLTYFASPVANNSGPFNNPTPKKNIQRQMKILYQKIALRHGYKREGYFFVKQLGNNGK